VRIVCRFCALNLLLLLTFSLRSFGDETNQAPAAPSLWLQDTNSQEILHAILGLEGQLQSNQIAIEQNGKEAREAAARSAELLSKSLQSIQETFSSQQQAFSERNTRELQTIQSSNRVVLLVGAIFAAVVALTLFLVVYFQWRISKVWTQISRVLPVSRGLGSGQDSRALGAGGPVAELAGLVDASSARLLHAMEQLESRLQGLEQNSTSSPGPHGSLAPAANGDPALHANLPTTSGAKLAGGTAQARIAAWLGQGQSMLKQNDWEAALHCFDEVLALAPNHSEALVKKGAALERLKKLNEAFECYDRAIAADESMTIAYLHKGGLCSRLERFKEALECYEKALRTHTDWGD
jgi:tetratricopeptide (TPR) repeat protein